MKLFPSCSLMLWISSVSIGSLSSCASAASTSSVVTLRRRPPKAHELTSEYTFNQYLIDFNKSIDPKSQDYQERKQIFESNLQLILNHNQNVVYDLETGQRRNVNEGMNGHTFHMGVNHLMDFSQDQLKSSLFGYHKSLIYPHLQKKYMKTATTATTRKMKVTFNNNYEKDLPFNVTDVSTLPTSFKYERVSPIKNQGSCGSCWSFSSIAALEGHLAKETGVLDVLSTQELISCVDNPNHCGGAGGCTGATAELAYAYIAQNGILIEDSFPYTSHDNITCPLHRDSIGGVLDVDLVQKTMLRHRNVKQLSVVAKIEGYTKLPSNDYKTLMNAVAKHSPVVIAAAASSWVFYEGGVFSPSDTSNPNVWDLNHGIVVEGYGRLLILLDIRRILLFTLTST